MKGNVPIKRKSFLKDVGAKGLMDGRQPKRAEPDNAPPKRTKSKITPTSKAGPIKQHGSKAEKKLRDVRL